MCNQLVAAVVADQSQELAGNQSAAYAQLEARMVKVENHYTHVMGQINQPQPNYQPAKLDFFSQYKNVIILGAVILFAVMLSGKSTACEGTTGSSSLSNIGTKALAKLIDVGVTKGVGSLLK